MTAAQTALLRIREEMHERKITQRDLAEAFDCSQGRIAKILNGGVNLRVSDLELLAKIVKLDLVEVVRNRGVDFVAELAPTELAMLTAYRRKTHLQNAIQVILGIAKPSDAKSDTVVSKRRKVGRPLNSERLKNHG